jgi:malonyl-CoA/methylmalonyl-CoA synthetase
MRAPVPPGRWPAAPVLPPDPTLPGLWRTRWEAHPGAPVLVDGRDPANVVHAGALAERTARLGAALAARGVGPGDRVLWSARATLGAVESLVAVLRLGAVLVTVNPSATPAEVTHVVGDCTPSIVLSDDPGADRFPPSVAVLGVGDLLAAADGPGDPDPVLDPSADALIVYTSGTTGTPKGAVHTHASLLAGVTSVVGAWGWDDHDRLILTLPLFHVHGLCAGLFGTLAAGASATVFGSFDEDAVLAAAGDEANTMFFGVPTMYHRLAATRRSGALSRLRLCVSGSAPLAADLWSQFDAQGVPVLERYGMTETLLTLSNPLEGERRPGSVGVPLPGVEAALHYDDVAPSDAGELYVRGPSLCRGYWGRPAHDHLGADGWFATGDLASLSDDGYVSIRGRRTELIITGGHNVYPAEVEAVLARHPGVAEVAVVGLPDPEWGETVVAFVVGDPDVESLHRLAAAELAAFKRPRDVRLVDVLPRNALGKIVRSELH